MFFFLIFNLKTMEMYRITQIGIYCQLIRTMEVITCTIRIQKGESKRYENWPMQDTDNFSALKIENCIEKMLFYFNMFAQNINCGYTLEPPRRGGSYVYPQSKFRIKN